MSNARPDRRFKRPLILFRLKIKFAGHARALRDKDRQTARARCSQHWQSNFPETCFTPKNSPEFSSLAEPPIPCCHLDRGLQPEWRDLLLLTCVRNITARQH